MLLYKNYALLLHMDEIHYKYTLFERNSKNPPPVLDHATRLKRFGHRNWFRPPFYVSLLLYHPEAKVSLSVALCCYFGNVSAAAALPHWLGMGCLCVTVLIEQEGPIDWLIVWGMHWMDASVSCRVFPSPSLPIGPSRQARRWLQTEIKLIVRSF